jgi:hypothetical protein
MKILIVREFQKPVLRPFYDQIAEVLPKSAPTLHLMGLTISHLWGYAGIST